MNEMNEMNETEAATNGVKHESSLDAWVARAKQYEPWGLAVGIGIQLLVLFTMIVMGTLKLATPG